MDYRKHHYVPTFMLERWHTGRDNKLTAFRWDHGRFLGSRCKARSVAKLEHLYSLQRSKANPNVKMEQDFMGPHVDDPASVVLQKIIASGVRSLVDNEKRTWSRFLVSLLLRGPSTIQHIRTRGRAVLAASFGETPDEYLAMRGDEPEPTLRAWFEKNDPDALDDLGVLAIPQLIGSERLNGALLNARWATRPLKKSRFDLLIADSPLLIVGGLSRPFLTVLPIAPQLVFLAFNDDKFWDAVLRYSDEAFVRETNLTTVIEADNYVYASNANQEPFVRKYLRQQA